MGAAESNPDTPKFGYHVLQVQPGSPGENAGLASFFDFVVAAGGVHFDREDTRFVDALKSNLGKDLSIVVYNLRTDSLREAIVRPSDSWGGAGLAGISIRYCSFEHATEHVWHILDVYPNSPASAAGLKARIDYIVGTPELLFNDSEDLFTLISSNEGKAIPLYVYSTDTDDIRLVSIMPNTHWGGTGSMGCDVGYGYLHRIPMNRGLPPASTAENSTNATATSKYFAPGQNHQQQQQTSPRTSPMSFPTPPQPQWVTQTLTPVPPRPQYQYQQPQQLPHIPLYQPNLEQLSASSHGTQAATGMAPITLTAPTATQFMNRPPFPPNQQPELKVEATEPILLQATTPPFPQQSFQHQQFSAPQNQSK